MRSYDKVPLRLLVQPGLELLLLLVGRVGVLTGEGVGQARLNTRYRAAHLESGLNTSLDVVGVLGTVIVRRREIFVVEPLLSVGLGLLADITADDVSVSGSE